MWFFAQEPFQGTAFPLAAFPALGLQTELRLTSRRRLRLRLWVSQLVESQAGGRPL